MTVSSEGVNFGSVLTKSDGVFPSVDVHVDLT